MLVDALGVTARGRSSTCSSTLLISSHNIFIPFMLYTQDFLLFFLFSALVVAWSCRHSWPASGKGTAGVHVIEKIKVSDGTPHIASSRRQQLHSISGFELSYRISRRTYGCRRGTVEDYKNPSTNNNWIRPTISQSSEIRHFAT